MTNAIFVIRAIFVNSQLGFLVEHKTDCLCIQFNGGHFAFGAPLHNSREEPVRASPPPVAPPTLTCHTPGTGMPKLALTRLKASRQGVFYSDTY